MLLFIIPFMNIKHSKKNLQDCFVVLLSRMPYLLWNFRKPSASKKKGLLFTINDNIVSFGPFLSKRSKANFFVSLPVCFFLLLLFFILDELYKLNFFFLCI